MEKVIQVEGMSCGHCVNTIEGSVGKMDGVESVKVNLENANVTVAFNESAVTEKAIVDVIEDQGYDVK